MKHLRASLECGDMIAAKSGLLSPEEAIQDLAYQFDDPVPTKVGLETFVRQGDTDIVMPPSYAVTSLEGMSDGMAHLIAAVIAGIVLLIVKFGDWFSGKGSPAGKSGGGSGYIHIRFERSKLSEEALKRQRQTYKDFSDTLNQRGPTMEPKVKDLNDKPIRGHEEVVRSVDDIVEVTYRDIQSDDAQHILVDGDPYISDIVDKKAHCDFLGDFSMAASSIGKTIQQIGQTIRGAASHDISDDLSNGIIRDTYRLLPSQIRWTHGKLTIKEIAEKFRSSLEEIRSNPQMRKRTYSVLLDDLTRNYVNLGLTESLEQMEQVPTVISDMQHDLESIASRFEKFKTDGGEQSAATKEAVEQYGAWLRSVGEMLSGAMVIVVHLTKYQEQMVKALAKFASVGDFAIAELTRNLEPHERHEIEDAIKNARAASKEIKLLASPKE